MRVHSAYFIHPVETRHGVSLNQCKSKSNVAATFRLPQRNTERSGGLKASATDTISASICDWIQDNKEKGKEIGCHCEG
jgi:hypothetical protein